MASLKAARTFQGPLITLRGLCELEDRAPTFSLRDVVSADGLRQFSGRVSAGDVDATWEMSVWGNGAWSAKADFHDGGVVAGDFFFLELLLDANHAVGAKLEGSILNLLDNRHLSLRKDGADRWIRRTGIGSRASARRSACMPLRRSANSWRRRLSCLHPFPSSSCSPASSS